MPVTPRGRGLSLTRVPRSKLAESVADQLLAEIRNKELARGTRMPSERELMTALGVGRSTIREAINGLALVGVLEIRHGQGAFVVDAEAGAAVQPALALALTRGLTRDLFEARGLVEVEVAALAAARRTSSELRELEQALDDHEQALREGNSGVAPAVRFHTCVAGAAHNELLLGFVASFAKSLAERGPLLEATPGYGEWEIGQHRSVYEPVRDGDAELAAERMRAHLDAVVRHHERIGLS